MAATIIDGKGLALKVRAEVAEEVAAFGEPICLATILVGDDPASHIYVGSKHKASAEAGIEGRDHRFPATASESEILDLIAELNADDRVDGILVQLPLPEHMDEAKVTYAVDPAKDVDGFHPLNAGRLYLGQPLLVPATPLGVMRMLEEYDVELEGANAVVIGRSEIVGKPMAMLLLLENATVTICHSRTRDLAAHHARRRRPRRGGRAPGSRDAGHGETRRDRDRRGHGPHRRGPLRRRRQGGRGRGRAPHARSRRGGADDDRDAPPQHGDGGATPPTRGCGARSVGATVRRV